MSGSSTVEQLFQQHTVGEIKAIERRFHADIERKKEDLRLLVGERYKDVIDVSDALVSMRTNTSQMHTRLKKVHQLCSNFEKSHTVQSEPTRPQPDADLVIGCQIKLLAIMPEKILLLLDEKKFVKSVQLLKLGSEIKTSLTRHSSQYRDRMKRRFPVVDRVSIGQLGHIIRSNLHASLARLVDGVLQDPTSEPALLEDDAREMVQAVSLMDGLPLDEAVKYCLDRVTKCIMEVIKDDNSRYSVRELLLGLDWTIIRTLALFSPIINDSDAGKADPEPTSVFSSLYPGQARLASLLPDNITSFQVRVEERASPEAMRAVVIGWYRALLAGVERPVLDQLTFVSSVKALANIKHDLLNSHADGILDKINERLSENVDVWKDSLEKLFTSSLKVLVMKSAGDKWSEMKQFMDHRISPLQSHGINPKERHAEQEVADFVWSESATADLAALPLQSPGRLASSNHGSGGFGGGGYRAETPAVISTVKKLDEVISGMISRCEEYFGCDCPPEFAHEISLFILTKLVEELSGQFEAAVRESQQLARVEVLMRLVSFTSNFSSSVKSMSHIEDGKEVQSRLRSLYSKTQHRWVQLMVGEARFSLTYPECRDPMLAATWEQMDIQEENEEGVSVSSKISFPMKASYIVHQMLSCIVTSVNRATCMAEFNPSDSPLLPLIRSSLVETVANQLTGCLGQLDSSEQTNDTKFVLQMIYDIKFLISVLALQDAEKATLTKFLQTFEDKVDPFDYDVLSTHISQRVWTEVSHCQQLYGYLFSHHAPIAAPASAHPVTSSRTHNLCRLLPSPVKFQSLAIPGGAGSFGLSKKRLGQFKADGGVSAMPTAASTNSDNKSQSWVKGWWSGS